MFRELSQVFLTIFANADLGFGVLEAFLDDRKQCRGWNERAINVALRNVTLDAKHIRRMQESCIEMKYA
jgi:hypothetical protein